MATIHSSLWESGQKEQLTFNHHYKKKARTLRVPVGEKVIFYEHHDHTGKKSNIFYEGYYPDLSWYGIKGTAGVIVVDKCGLQPRDLIQLNWYRSFTSGGKTHWFQMTRKFPVGDYMKVEPNDEIDEVELPMGMCVHLYRDTEYQGGYKVFRGESDTKRTRFKLKDYDFQDTVSSMRVSADQWEFAGISLTNPKVLECDDKFARALCFANNYDIEQEVTDTVSVTKERTVETNWNIGGRAMVKIEAAITTGIVETTVGGEVEISGGYGESESKTKSITTEVSPTYTVAPHDTIYGSMMVENGKTEFDIERKWRNTETGYTVSEKGKLTVEEAGSTYVEVHG